MLSVTPWSADLPGDSATGPRPPHTPHPLPSSRVCSPGAQAVWAPPYAGGLRGCPFPQLCVTLCPPSPEIAAPPICSSCLSPHFCGGSELVFGWEKGQETDTVSLPPFSTPPSRELHTRRLCLLLQQQPSPRAAWLPSAHLPSDHQAYWDPATPHGGHSLGPS